MHKPSWIPPMKSAVAALALILTAQPALPQELPPFSAWPPHAQAWACTVLDGHGDPWAAEDAGAQKPFGVRGAAFQAAGLAMRGRAEDHERVARATAAILRQQYNTPGKPYHGTYKRSSGDASMPAAMWRPFQEYDPNWREFVGLSLIIVLECMGDRLEPGLVSRTHDSLRIACEGAFARAVRWSYTNIALMSAYLLTWGGREFDEPAWTAQGEALAAEIFAEFEKNGTFWEYNSPTYNGVNFFALGLWRRMPVNDRMQRRGEAMDAALWRDVARFYHAGLGNLCGPYDRTYGMDMQRYVAITGIAIDLATGTCAANPGLTENAEKSSELAYLPLLAGLGMEPPQDALAHLRAFQGPRAFSRMITEGKDQRIAHAWLAQDWMVGIETMARGAKTSGQFRPITAHWRNDRGQLCAMGLTGDAPLTITLAEERDHAAIVTLRFAGKDAELNFSVDAPGATAGAFTPESWALPGMAVQLVPGSFTQEVTQHGDAFRIRLTPSREERAAALGIAFVPAN